MIIALSGAILSIGIYSGLVVVGHQRYVARRHVVKRTRSALRHEGVSEGGRIADRFLGDDVDGSTDGRRTEEGRATAADHLHAVYHICRNLLQTIHAVQRGEYRARIHQYLRVVAVETIDAHLCEAAVLTVVLRAYAGLEFESLGKTG